MTSGGVPGEDFGMQNLILTVPEGKIFRSRVEKMENKSLGNKINKSFIFQLRISLYDLRRCPRGGFWRAEFDFDGPGRQFLDLESKNRKREF